MRLYAVAHGALDQRMLTASFVANKLRDKLYLIDSYLVGRLADTYKEAGDSDMANRLYDLEERLIQ